MLERIDEQLATFGGPDLVLRGERRLIATSIGGRYEKKPHLPPASPFLYPLFSPYPSQRVGDIMFSSLQEAIAVGLSYYPERLGQQLIVNVPPKDSALILLAVRSLGLGVAIDDRRLRVLAGNRSEWPPELLKVRK